MLSLRPYYNFIFFVTYEWAQKARVFRYNSLERLDKDNLLQLIVPIHKLWRKWSVPIS
jgi:hypothetical protein